MYLYQENVTPPSSAPPVFTPPEIPEFLLADELAQMEGNYMMTDLVQYFTYEKYFHENSIFYLERERRWITSI